MPEMDGCAAARVIRHCGKPDAKTTPHRQRRAGGVNKHPLHKAGGVCFGLIQG